MVDSIAQTNPSMYVPIIETPQASADESDPELALYSEFLSPKTDLSDWFQNKPRSRAISKGEDRIFPPKSPAKFSAMVADSRLNECLIKR